MGGGCFLSGDGCYGPAADPSTVPWAMSFPNGQVPTYEPVHPTPIYEAVLSTLVVLVVRCTMPLPAAPPEPEVDEAGEVAVIECAVCVDEPVFPKYGRRTAATHVLYGLERVLIEQFRRHPPIVFFGGLTEYQALAVGLLLIGVCLEARARLSRKSMRTDTPAG